jgi:hypothetical protein
LVYALRRVAGEASLPLALDELRPFAGGEGLSSRWVDLDLRAGTAEQALRGLQQHVGGFTHEFRHGLIHVRTAVKPGVDTGIDRKEIGDGTFEGDLKGLGAWVQSVRPNTFLGVHLEVGHPVGPNVKLRVPANSSVLDVLLLYAKESGVGWRLRRAGQRFPVSTHQTAIISTEVQPWKALTEPHHTAPFRQHGSMIQSLGQIAARTGATICVIDAAPLLLNRGTLDHALGADAGFTLEKTLNELAAMHMPNSPPNMTWQQLDGITFVRAEALDRFPILEETLKDQLSEGEFHGSLPELGRWISHRLAETSGRRIAAGEIVPDGPRARLHVEPGTTVEQLLLDFARATGQGWYLVIRDRRKKGSPHPRPWHGAYLSDVLEWGQQATPY